MHTKQISLGLENSVYCFELVFSKQGQTTKINLERILEKYTEETGHKTLIEI